MKTRPGGQGRFAHGRNWPPGLLTGGFVPIVYRRENGYDNADLKAVEEILDRVLPPGSLDKVALKALLYDYGVLRAVIDGKAIFGHPDGSETRRLRLYTR